MNDGTAVFDQIAEYGVVPVIAMDSVDAAIPLADALIAGGLPVAEITFRTAAAAAVIRKLAEERPALLVGAGTVLTEDNARAAKDCGARFAVAPGLNPLIVAKARDVGLPFVPGVATPSDIEQGLTLGCKLLKFFPAGNLGGPAMLKSLSGPYAHTGVKFVPTGGVNAANLADYLGLGVVAAVGGTWIAKKDDLAGGRWREIQERCEAVCQAIARLRESA
ncbi:MAG: bifunctional 4-hydroxy-2-oxoglutarate aldolase/2-dehydro-3-deoxy-phosphogluconate aldolase [Nitrospiraceae bacterium]|nr:bifunctional 4-hydroxy-2-oxoglutarate aldolase/2-dehydro-3-deoxy-phosphogluconate aldolase [Nitrospiraceae bacterium]